MPKLPLYSVIFHSQRQMNLAVGRVSQFLDDPELHGKTFTLEEMIEADRRARGIGPRAAGYLDYWEGHDFPKTHFERFRKAGFTDFSPVELAMIKIVRELPKNAQVITVFDVSSHILAHEIVHGLYDHWPKYRRDVEAAIRRHRTRDIRRALTKMGYRPTSHLQEINAYLTTGVEPSAGMCGPDERKLRTELDRILRKHLGYGFLFKNKKTGLVRVRKLIHEIRFPRMA